MKHKIGTCPNANPDSDELCPVCHKCKEPECTRGEGHTGLHFSESKMPPKTNEDYVEDFKELCEHNGVIGTTRISLAVFVLHILKEKDKQKEEAVETAKKEQRERDANIIRNSGWHVAEKLARKIFGGAEVNWYTQKQLDGRVEEAVAEAQRRADIKYDAAVYEVYGSEGALKVRAKLKSLTPPTN